MPYDRDLRLRALEYAKEDHSLTQSAAVFKINISTIIAWKRRYEATGDVKMKVRCPVNKKIISENTTCSTISNRPTSSKSYK